MFDLKIQQTQCLNTKRKEKKSPQNVYPGSQSITAEYFPDIEQPLSEAKCINTEFPWRYTLLWLWMLESVGQVSILMSNLLLMYKCMYVMYMAAFRSEILTSESEKSTGNNLEKYTFYFKSTQKR